MTSSFRPDRLLPERTFVPVSFVFAGASATQGGVSQAFDAGSRVAGDPSSNEAPLSDPRPEANEASPPGPPPAGSEASPPGPTPAEIEALEQAAFARGRAAAEAAALAEAGRIESACAALEAAAAQWQALSASGAATWRTGLLDLAATIARRWVGAELRIAPERLIALVERAARSVETSEPFICALHPEDHASVLASLGDRSRTGRPIEAMRFEVEAGLERGEFLLRAGAMGIDGRFEAILRDLDTWLREAFEDEPEAAFAPEARPGEEGAA